MFMLGPNGSPFQVAKGHCWTPNFISQVSAWPLVLVHFLYEIDELYILYLNSQSQINHKMTELSIAMIVTAVLHEKSMVRPNF